MIVDLSIDQASQADFDRFYHDFYIPEFLKAVPEIAAAGRYAQIDSPPGSDRRFLTIYDLSSAGSVSGVENAIARSAHREASDQFKIWKQKLTHFDRGFYSEAHWCGRQAGHADWNDQPFLVLRWSARSGVSDTACSGHFNRYIEALMDGVQPLSSARTYRRTGSEPGIFWTVFTASDQAAVAALRAAVEESLPHGGITPWLDAATTPPQITAFEPIYRVSK